MKRTIAFMLALSLLGANATFAGNADTAVASPAKVLVYRSQPSAQGAYVNYRYYLNGQFWGRLKTGQYLLQELPAGKHALLVNNRERSRMQLELGEGQLLVLKARVDRHGQLALQVADQQQALRDLPDLAGVLPGSTDQQLSQR